MAAMFLLSRRVPRNRHKRGLPRCPPLQLLHVPLCSTPASHRRQQLLGQIGKAVHLIISNNLVWKTCGDSDRECAGSGPSRGCDGTGDWPSQRL